MSDHMFYFTDGADETEADMQILLETRAEVADLIKAADKITCEARGSTCFKELLEKLKSISAHGKDIAAVCSMQHDGETGHFVLLFDSKSLETQRRCESPQLSRWPL